MNSAPSPDPRDEEQASLWAARLDGATLTSDQRGELDRWLAGDPARRVLLSAYCQFSADLEQQLPLLAGIKDEAAEALTASKTARPHPWLSRPIWAGMALIAAAAVAVVLWRGRPQDQFANLSTPVAQRQSVTLADGSQVELNARTALAIELNGRERHVRLSGGEAFFQVSKDPSRPFFVETPSGLVRVTGTRFNVRADSARDLEVTVLEGSVQVRPGDGAALASLHAGDQLVRTGDQVGVHPLDPAKLDGALAWRQGQVVFDGTPLREALACYARYHGRNLTASDDAARQRVGGRHSLDDLNGFLADLEAALPDIRVIRDSDGSIRVEESHR